MGMAASQVKLLTLTSRLHDVENSAQNIQNQKVQLATQKDELYQAYCDALDAKKIQVAFYDGFNKKCYVDATFANLCKYDEDRCTQYSLKDSKTGKIIVDAETKRNYEDFGNDKYAFAFAMLGLDANDNWRDSSECMSQEIGIGKSQTSYGGRDGYDSNGNENLYMTDVERKVFEAHQDDEKIKKYWDNLQNAETDKDKREALEKFRDALYTNFSSEIYNYQNLDKKTNGNEDPEAADAEFCRSEEFPKDEFNYYVRMFENIQAAGGCVEVEPMYESGVDGNEWLNNMVTSGRVLIDVYNDNKKCWDETSLATCTNVNNLQRVSDDTNLKKAEAEYQYELDVINRKDTKFDNELNNLETERSAITKEMDGVKKVISENEDRTFGIFG